MLVLQPSTSAIRAMAEWLTTGSACCCWWSFWPPDRHSAAGLLLQVGPQDVPRRSQERTQGSRRPPHKGRIRQKQRRTGRPMPSVGAVPKADFVVMNPPPTTPWHSLRRTHHVSPPGDFARHRPGGHAHSRFGQATRFPCCSRPCWRAPVCARRAGPAHSGHPVRRRGQVLAYVYRLKAAMRGQGRMPGELVRPYVPPELDPHQTSPSAPDA